MIAILYGIPTFRQAWKQTALEFIKTARIQTTLPLEKGLSLQCHAIPGRRVTFLTAVVDITLPMPFRSITYGPAINRSANSDINSVYGKGASANKHSQNQTTTLIGAATETAKSTGGISVHRPGVLVPNFLGFKAQMHRKSNRPINNGCGNKKHAKPWNPLQSKTSYLPQMTEQVLENCLNPAFYHNKHRLFNLIQILKIFSRR